MKNSYLKVLLVDDDEDDYIVTEELLETAEIGLFELDWIDTYSEALEVIGEKRHDIYLLDYRLGPETGLELLKEAINRGVSAPIILLTGLGDNQIDQEAMKIGAADYLMKDQMDTAILERSILHALERKQRDAKQDQLLAELEEANRELKNFTYFISQDLQVPMRALGSLAEFMITYYEDKLDEKGKNMLLLIKKNVGRMKEKIDNFMNDSRFKNLVEEKTED